MATQFALEYVALAVAVGGLFAVVGEILVKDPSVFGDYIGGKAAAVRRAVMAVEIGAADAGRRQHA